MKNGSEYVGAMVHGPCRVEPHLTPPPLLHSAHPVLGHFSLQALGGAQGAADLMSGKLRMSVSR